MGRTKIYNRDELLDTTIQLFWKQGFADTSLADIEKATRVNKSGLYSEFADKDEMFVASLTRYIETNGVHELLSRMPLGKSNIVDLLKLGKSCTGQRGCFVVNSVRESAILPAKAGEIIQAHLKKVKALLIENVEATQSRGDAAVVTELIMTFNAGLCLELNANKAVPNEKIDAFVALLRL